MMKRILRMLRMPVIIIMLLLIFSLVGCGNSKNAANTEANKTANTASQTTEQSKLNSPSMTYLTYTNARFGFSLSYPDIYTVKTESDNGDGITMKNEDKRYTLKIWGANNVSNDNGAKLLAAAKKRVSHIVSESADDKTYQIEYSGGDKNPIIFDEIGCTVGDQVCGFIISYPEKEKESFKDIVTKMSTELTKNATAKTSATDNSSLTLTTSAGKTVAITLDENTTTGYSWHYVIGNTDLIKFDSENTADSDSSAASSVPGRVGAGSEHTWNFKGLKAGTTKITFRYYRGWETEKATVNTVEYTVKITK